jgi:hypothetical protein
MATFERIVPLLAYRDIAAAPDFLVRAFGFDSGGVHRWPDGQAVHGEVPPVAASSGCITPPRSITWTPRLAPTSRTRGWSSSWMMSTHTTSTPVRQEPASTGSPSISRMASENMARATPKATVGGFPRR